MSDLVASRERHGPTVAYRLTGSLDRAAAWALRERLERERADSLLLDFTAVREASDLALAVLAHGCSFSARPVALCGLGEHHLRIFRFCGVPLAAGAASPGANPLGAH